MGYTHYYGGLTATPVVVADARRIIAASGVTICGPRGEGLPVISETNGIRLNGLAAAGEAYDLLPFEHDWSRPSIPSLVLHNRPEAI